MKDSRFARWFVKTWTDCLENCGLLKRSHKTKKHPFKQRLSFETLEQRDQPSVTNVFSAGSLTINSDSASDSIQITGSSGAYSYRANGGSLQNFTGVTVITVNGGSGDDTIDASAITDIFLTISGANGNDVIYGGAGNDIISAGAGDDTVYAGAGNDTITDLGGNNTFYGQDGNDTITGYTGNDVIDGGNGDDILDGSLGTDSLSGGAGDDLFRVRGAEAVGDTIDGGSGNDTIRNMNSASLTLSSLNAVGGSTFVNNVEILNGNGYSITTPLTQANSLDFSGFSTISNVPSVLLNDGNDSIVTGPGFSAGVTIDAGTGNDTIDASGATVGLTLTGGNGNDVITGGSGNDVISAGGNDDIVYGGAGNDTIDGGDGNNQLYGQNGNDIITGYIGNDLINGGDGDDTIDGSRGVDTLIGGAGNDLFLIRGIEGEADSIDGGSGTDTIRNASNSNLTLNNLNTGGNTTYVNTEVFDGNGYMLVSQLSISNNIDLRSLGTLVNVSSVLLQDGADQIAILPPSSGAATLFDGGSGSDGISMSLSQSDFSTTDWNAITAYIASPTGKTLTVPAATSSGVGFSAANFETATLTTATGIPAQSSLDGASVSLNVPSYFGANVALSFSATNLPTGLSISSSGLITGTISNHASQAGGYSVTITGAGSGGSIGQSFIWTIENVAPVLTDDSNSTDQNTVVNGNVLSNDADGLPDSDQLTVTTTGLLPGTNGGGFSVSASGNYSFDPGADFRDLPHGQTRTTQVTYLVADGDGGVSSANLTITVEGRNDAPQSSNASLAGDEDSVYTFSRSDFNFSDIDYPANGFDAVLLETLPVKGSISFAGTVLTPGNLSSYSTVSISDIDAGKLTFTPSANESGSGYATFNFKVKDDGGTTDGWLNTSTHEYVVTFNIAAVNDSPVYIADLYHLTEGESLSIGAAGLLSNDTDIEGDSLVVSSYGWNGVSVEVGTLFLTPNGGELIIQSDGGFEYSPAESFVGIDYFTYTISDSHGGLASGDVYITILGDVPPTAIDDVYRVSESEILSVNSGLGVLLNDYMATTFPAPLQAHLTQGPSHGNLTFRTDGSFEYVPDASFTGSDAFFYKVTDTINESTPAEVKLVAGLYALDDAYSVSHREILSSGSGGSFENDFLSSAANPVGILMTNPAHGQVSFNTDGSFLYTPDDSYVGQDSFSYKIQAAAESSNTATIRINITNTTPVSAPHTYSAVEGATLSIDRFAGVLSDSQDADNDELTAQLIQGPSHGNLTLNADGSFSYIPDSGYTGTDEFYFKPFDGFDSGGLPNPNPFLIAGPGIQAAVLVQVVVQPAMAGPPAFISITGRVTYDTVVPNVTIRPVREAVVQLFSQPAGQNAPMLEATTKTTEGGFYTFIIPAGKPANSLFVKVLAETPAPDAAATRIRAISIKEPTLLPIQQALPWLGARLVLAAGLDAPLLMEQIKLLFFRQPAHGLPVPLQVLNMARAIFPQLVPTVQQAARDAITQGETFFVRQDVNGNNNANVVLNFNIGTATKSEKAFWTFDAALTGARARGSISAAEGRDFMIFLPALVNLFLPPNFQVTSVTPPGLNASVIKESDFDSWDTIIHEYGHQVQQGNGFFPFQLDEYAYFEMSGGRIGAPSQHKGVGNYRQETSNANTPLGILQRFAFSEGWAQFFSISAQARAPLETPSLANGNQVVSVAGIGRSGDLLAGAADMEISQIPSVGTAFGQQIANAPSAPLDSGSFGDDDENAVMRVLWDLYDGLGEGGRDRIEIGLSGVFDLLKNSGGLSLMGLVEKFNIAPRPISQVVDMGAILAQNNISVSSLDVSVGGNALFLANDLTRPTFTWEIPMGQQDLSTHMLLGSFSIQVYNQDYSQKFYDSGLVTVMQVVDDGLDVAGIPRRRVKLSFTPQVGTWPGVPDVGFVRIIIVGDKYSSDAFEFLVAG